MICKLIKNNERNMVVENTYIAQHDFKLHILFTIF